MNASPSVIHAFTQLNSICELQEEVHQGLEEFVCLLSGERATPVANVLQLPGRVTKFASNTWSSCTAHIACSLAVNCVVYGWCSQAEPSLPRPVEYGWTKNCVGFSPVVAKPDPVTVAVVELVRCNCSSSKCLTNRCLCKKLSMVCTDLWKCTHKEQCEGEHVDHYNGGMILVQRELPMTDNHDIFIE